jgi:hypothetical protein
MGGFNDLIVVSPSKFIKLFKILFYFFIIILGEIYITKWLIGSDNINGINY